MATVSGSKEYFAFCSTLSVYVYRTDGFLLKSLIDAHEKCISFLAWRKPPNCGQFATGSLDGEVTIWDCERQDNPRVATINVRSSVCALDWDPRAPASLLISVRTSSVYLWDSRKANVNNLQSMELWNNLNEATPARAEVLRWHPTNKALIASGNSDGSIRLFSISTLSIKKIPPIEKGVGICDMQWDPNSSDYMLACNNNGAIRLIDVSTGEGVRSYEREPKIQSICWMSWAPGSFCTCTLRTGVIKVWNVSQSKPIEHIRVGHTGFRSCSVIASTSRLVCSFSDGSVSLYDMLKKQMEFCTQPGHTETVFATKFSPHSPDILATSSYDSTIKIWHTGGMSLTSTLSGQEGVIYAMAWSSCGQYLASSSIKGTVYIWNASTGEILERCNHHHEEPVYCVDWSSLSNLLLSSGADYAACVFTEKGRLCRRFLLPAAVFGCMWNPHDSSLFVCGCMDGNAYVFSIAESGTNALKHCLIGHEGRVFHTAWSPIIQGALATGSDDRTIRVWNIPFHSEDIASIATRNYIEKFEEVDFGAASNNTRKKTLVRKCEVLEGHSNKVRPILWHSEVPHLLLSGSWDGDIRLWDTRVKTGNPCLFVAKGHLADVYGLSFHPERPFTLASSSRDSTVRLWAIVGKVTSKMMHSAIRDHTIKSFLGNDGNIPEESFLSGKASRKLSALLERHCAEDKYNSFRKVFSFFGGSVGLDEFWAAVGHVVGTSRAFDGKEFYERNQGRMQILHSSETVTNAIAEAHSLESIRMRRSSMGLGVGGMKKDEQIRLAAKMYAQGGDLQKFCDILYELGDCEKALAIAPGVGMAYWEEMSKRYARTLAENLSEDSLPFFVTSGRANEAVEFYSSRRQFKEAFLVASAASAGRFPTPREREGEAKEETELGNNSEDALTRSLLRKCSKNMAEHFVEAGEAVLAATSYLASDDVSAAIEILLDKDEFLLALR